MVATDANAAANLTISGDVLITGNRTVTVNNGTVFGMPAFFAVGAIGDGDNGYALTKAGPGALVFLGTNTYPGGTTVITGGLVIGSVGALPG